MQISRVQISRDTSHQNLPVVRSPLVSRLPAISQLSMKVLHGFLKNFSCWLHWTMCSAFFLISFFFSKLALNFLLNSHGISTGLDYWNFELPLFQDFFQKFRIHYCKIWVRSFGAFSIFDIRMWEAERTGRLAYYDYKSNIWWLSVLRLTLLKNHQMPFVSAPFYMELVKWIWPENI